ncbi:MAG: GFA family protein [Candidatus Binatia bacterium]
MNAHREGGCLCGAVRYRAAGEPTQATFCHCRSCRKAAGSPLVAWVTFPSSGFAFTSGDPVAFRSSEPVVRTFCGACGTPLTYSHRDHPSGVDVTIASLDEPEAIEPADHTWTSHRLPWVHVGDHLPAYPKARP